MPPEDSKVARQKYAFRLRFRAGKGVTTDSDKLDFVLAGKQVRLQSPNEDPLMHGGWLCLKSNDFDTLEEAAAFGGRLKLALQMSSIRLLLGVDVGEDKATASFSRAIIEALEQQGHYNRSNIHGLDVYPDKTGTSWLGISATGHVSIDPQKFTRELEYTMGLAPADEPENFDVARLLNEAIMANEPAAQLVLALAAVEMLAQGQDWTSKQKSVLERLAQSVEADPDISPDEQQEIAQSIRRSMQRMGVRQGLRRLLKKLNLEDLWRQFDDIYDRRSKILHGVVYAKPDERRDLVSPTLQLCCRIVLSALERDVQGIAASVDLATTGT